MPCRDQHDVQNGAVTTLVALRPGRRCLPDGADVRVVGALASCDPQKMKGISIVVDRLYPGYESGKRPAMKRSSIRAL